MTIICDFSQIAHAIVHVDAAAQQVVMNPSNENKGFFKHFMLNSVRSNFVKHKKKYGQMIIATDSNKGYWRRDFFPNYKVQRRLAKAAKANEPQAIDWDWVGEVVDELIVDMRTYLQFPVINVDKAEGDDVIGVLTKYITETSTTEDIFGESSPEDILILSSDRDNLQLKKYRNVQIYSPRENKLIVPDGGYRKALIEKIVKGEAGPTSDSIPNIRSGDDIFLQEGVRQGPITQKRLDEFYAAARLEDACLNDDERKNLLRNQTLVDYDYIPDQIRDTIIDVYKQQLSKKAPKMAFMDYLMRNRMSNILSNITDFYL